jgi:hypothetical protein
MFCPLRNKFQRARKSSSGWMLYKSNLTFPSEAVSVSEESNLIGYYIRIMLPAVELGNCCLLSYLMKTKIHIWDPKVREGGTLIKILCFRTISTVLFLSKTQIFGDSSDRDQLYRLDSLSRLLHEDGYRIHSRKHFVLNKNREVF